MRTSKYAAAYSGRLIRLAGSLLLTCAGALALSAQSEPVPEATAPARPTASDAASQQLIRNFLTVVGGAEAYGALKNVVARGTLQEAGVSKTFQLTELQDGRRHLRLSWRQLGREYAEQFVFDGQHAWRQELSPKYQDAVDYSGQEGVHFSRQRWLLQPFAGHAAAAYVFRYQGQAKVGSRDCHIVVGYGENNERSWFYFDQEKFLILRWGGLGQIAGIQEYMDYRAAKFQRVAGVLLPRAIDLLAENAAFGQIEFEAILPNQEIGPALFSRPEKRTPLLRRATVTERP